LTPDSCPQPNQLDQTKIDAKNGTVEIEEVARRRKKELEEVQKTAAGLGQAGPKTNLAWLRRTSHAGMVEAGVEKSQGGGRGVHWSPPLEIDP